MCGQFTVRALARHLVDPLGGPSTRYYITLALLHLQMHDMDAVEEDIKTALQLDYQVWSSSSSLFSVIVVRKVFRFDA